MHTAAFQLRTAGANHYSGLVMVVVLNIQLIPLNMDTVNDLIIDYSVVQVAETGSSVAMEIEDSSALQIDSNCY